MGGHEETWSAAAPSTERQCQPTACDGETTASAGPAAATAAWSSLELALVWMMLPGETRERRRHGGWYRPSGRCDAFPRNPSSSSSSSYWSSSSSSSCCGTLLIVVAVAGNQSTHDDSGRGSCEIGATKSIVFVVVITNPDSCKRNQSPVRASPFIPPMNLILSPSHRFLT